MTSSHFDPVGRPTPIRDAVKTVGGVVSLLGSVAVFAASWGLLSADQASSLDALLALVPTVATALTGLVAAFGVAVRSEPLVTPVEDPRDNAGQPLVPAVPPASLQG